MCSSDLREHPDIALVLNMLGYWELRVGQLEVADQHLSEALGMRAHLVGDQDPSYGSSLLTLGSLRIQQQRFSEALLLAQRAEGLFSRDGGDKSWKRAMAETVEADALSGLGRRGEARRVAQKALAADWSAAMPQFRAQMQATIRRLGASP